MKTADISTPLHEPVRSGSRQFLNRRTLLLSLLLVAVTVALYFPVSQHPFLNFDDSLYVTENPQVQNGLNAETVKWAFTAYEADNWHPLTWLSHALDCQLFGLDPTGPHQINMALHALNALLLFWVLLWATGATGPSFMVAALFALHPINVESVAWISERKNLLSMVFFLLALGAYRWYVSKPDTGRYTGVAVLFAMGLMCKPQIITFPFLLLLWDYWPLQRMAVGRNAAAGAAPQSSRKTFSWLVGEKVPLFVLALASAIITMQAQRSGGAVSSYIPLYARISTAIVSYLQYLGRAVWPLHLGALYPYPTSPFKFWIVAEALAVLVGISVWAFWERHRRPYLVVGWLWFLGALVPMIGLVQVGAQATADRYAYLSFIGLFIMICWGAADWAQEHRMPKAVVAGAAVLVLVALSVLAHRQIGYWSDNVTLWTRTLQVTQNNWIAENNLGTALLEANRGDTALQHFEAALSLNPYDPLTNMNVAVNEQKHGELLKAIEHYQNVIRYTANDAGRMSRLRHDAYYRMGLAYRDQGDSEDASRSLEEAEKIRRQYAQ
jgi:tetratricopeptide (TPR) repeat protein